MKSSSNTERALAAALRVSAALFGVGARRDPRSKDDDDDDDLPRPNATVSLRTGLVLGAAFAF
jgi:uncharacterized membrane protein (UPF0136 family)